MADKGRKDDTALTPEERKLRIEETRLALDHSFAKKWLPTLATVMAGLIAGIFGWVQQQNAIEETKRARIEAKAKDEREWGLKVIEMYFKDPKLFDLTKNPETAALNLRVLAAVAPTAVQGVLNAERSRIPAPTSGDDTARLESLAAVAGVQDAVVAARTQTTQTPVQPPAQAALQPSDFTVYVQYAGDDRDTAAKAQSLLTKMGYRAPGIEKVAKVPSRLQVRYYRPEQKAFAGALAVELGKALDLSASSDNAILVTSSKPLPGGILELWLPAKAG
jgi:hypothetical protein